MVNMKDVGMSHRNALNGAGLRSIKVYIAECAYRFLNSMQVICGLKQKGTCQNSYLLAYMGHHNLY